MKVDDAIGLPEWQAYDEAMARARRVNDDPKASARQRCDAVLQAQRKYRVFAAAVQAHDMAEPFARKAIGFAAMAALAEAGVDIVMAGAGEAEADKIGIAVANMIVDLEREPV